MSTENKNNEDTSLLPITGLYPSEPPPSNRHIRAVVTLLWPYSSSTRSCALLLGDPDFRLRLHRGQVRVRLHGPCARVVAERQVGIGDTVELSLSGAKWVAEDVPTALKTPGKSVEAELDYGQNLDLKVWDDGGVVKHINVHEREDEVWKKSTERDGLVGTPEGRKGKSDWISGFYGAVPIYSSPAFVRRARLSAEGGSFADGFDPFDAWEEDEKRPRKKQRFSIDGFKGWRYAARSPSPEEEFAGNHDPEVQGEEAQRSSRDEESVPGVEQSAKGALELVDKIQGMFQEAMAGRPSDVSKAHQDRTTISESRRSPSNRESQIMQPPPPPLLQIPTNPPTAPTEHDTQVESPGDDRPSTPKLHPIASETLPLPSPFPNDAAQLQLGALQSILCPHLEVVAQTDANPLLVPSDSANLPQRSTRDPESFSKDISPDDTGTENIEHPAAGIQGRGIYSTDDVLPSQEIESADEDVRTRENSEDASVLKLPYINELSDTEEDDGEMYTKRFPQNLFDPSQDADDATEDEDEDEDKSGEATLVGDASSYQTSLPVNEPSGSPSDGRQPHGEASITPPLGPSTAVNESHQSASPKSQTLRNESPRITDLAEAGMAARKPIPQSEKDRIMNETYRSLFGWRTSSVQNDAFGQPPRASQALDVGIVDGDLSRTSDVVFDDGQKHHPSVDDQLVVNTDSRQDEQIQATLSPIREVIDFVSSEQDTTLLHSIQDALLQAPTASEQAEIIAEEMFDFDKLEETDNHIIDAEQDVATHGDVRTLQEPAQLTQVPDLPTTPTAVTCTSSMTSAEREDRREVEALQTFPPEILSFPSTTVVATDNMSSMEQASFEQLFNQTTTAAGELDPALLESFDSQPMREDSQAPDAREHEVAPPSVSKPELEHSERDSGSGELVATQEIFNEKEALLPRDDDGDDSLKEIPEIEHVVPVDPSSDPQQTSTKLTAKSQNQSKSVTSVQSEFSENIVELQHSHAFAELPVQPRQVPRQQSPSHPTQLVAYGVSCSDAGNTQGKTDSREATANSDAPTLQDKYLPTESIAPRSTSPVNETGVAAQRKGPQTPTLQLSFDRSIPQEDSHDRLLSLSPVSTSLRRSTRTIRKPKANESPSELAKAISSSQASPQDRTPAKKSAREPEVSTIPEIDLLTTRATPARKSSRIQRQSQILEEISHPEIRENVESTMPSPKKSRKSRGREESSLPTLQTTIEPVASSSKQRTSTKRLTTSKYTEVPEVISQWFSPRRSSRLHDEVSVGTPVKESTSMREQSEEASEEIVVKIRDPKTQNKKKQISGIRTSLSYYTPLSSLDGKLNIASQPSADNTVDILAVVSDETKVPERSKSGPRDYYTIFHITDPSMPSETSVPVEVFRPWHAILPVARVGDVVLLRAYTVKSRKHQPYLRSTDASAWCVWRFSEDGSGSTNGSSEQQRGIPEDSSPTKVATTMTTASARRRLSTSTTTTTPATHFTREEVKGPPVELGEQERESAKTLRDWWEGGSVKNP